MRLPNPLCMFSVAWDFVRGVLRVGVPFGGHRMVEDARLNNCIVTVLKCERCAYVSVGWERTARSTSEPYPDAPTEEERT